MAMIRKKNILTCRVRTRLKKTNLNVIIYCAIWCLQKLLSYKLQLIKHQSVKRSVLAESKFVFAMSISRSLVMNAYYVHVHWLTALSCVFNTNILSSRKGTSTSVPNFYNKMLYFKM